MKKIVFVVALLLSAMTLALASGSSGNTMGRPKVWGIAFVKFKTTGLAKANSFYGKLGLPSASVKNGNAVQASFAVNPTQWVELGTAAQGTHGPYLEEIGLATDNLLEMRAYLTARGVPANEIFQWPEGTSYFETQDPEGTKLVFVQRSMGAAGPGPGGSISHKLIHVGMRVKNASVENHFYRDLLGFRLYWEGGMKSGETDWVAMQVPDGTDWIEYMLNVPAGADKRVLGVMNHISLGVPDIHAAAKELEKNGVDLPEQPQIGRDGKWQLNVYDPDGTRVEFMEFTPVQKPCCSEFMGPHPKP